MDYTGEQIRIGGCVFCGCTEFLEGPCGGLSVNVECDRCGARFNFMPPYGADLISGPTKPYTKLPDPPAKHGARGWWQFWRS